MRRIVAASKKSDRYVIAADQVFDGTRVLEDHAVAVWGDRIAAVAPADRLPGQGQLIRFAGTLLPGSPADLARFIADETDKWGKVIRVAGIKPE